MPSEFNNILSVILQPLKEEADYQEGLNQYQIDNAIGSILAAHESALTQAREQALRYAYDAVERALDTKWDEHGIDTETAIKEDLEVLESQSNPETLLNNNGLGGSEEPMSNPAELKTKQERTINP